MKTILILVACFILGACSRVETDGPDAQGYRWVKDGPVGTPVIHRDMDTFLYCGLEEKSKSCAIHRANKVCDIYLPKNPEAWQEPHELRHCDGWRHPDPVPQANTRSRLVALAPRSSSFSASLALPALSLRENHGL